MTNCVDDELADLSGFRAIFFQNQILKQLKYKIEFNLRFFVRLEKYLLLHVCFEHLVLV